MSRSPIAVTLALWALAGSSTTFADEATGSSAEQERAAGASVGSIVAFRGDEIDVYDAAGEFLCVVAPEVLERGTSGDPCTAAPGSGKAAALPIREVTDDGQFRVVLGGKSFRLDPFQVDAQMDEAPDVKSRCPQLAGRTEMAATRGLGESGCDTKEP